jgi:ribosomal protein S18 acetylase RimI-like enzyme
MNVGDTATNPGARGALARDRVAIDALRRQHTRVAAEVLAESHHDYPIFRHLFPDSDRRRRALRGFFRGVVRDACRLGASHAAAGAGGALLGVAVWLPPGTYPWSALRKLRAVPALLRVALVAPGSASDFARTGANTERAHPAEPHWYLEVLGVRPEAQGLGVGTQLLGLGLARAERAGLPCYLETARRQNVGYYARFGFEVVDDALALVPSGPTHWAMWRPPANRPDELPGPGDCRDLDHRTDGGST